MESDGQPVRICLRSAFVIYQDPLAYLLGLEGIALLDAWAGDHDRAFTDARLAEIRKLLDDEKLRDRGVFAERVSTVLAYEQQAIGYDKEAGGGLFAADEPVVAAPSGSRPPEPATEIGDWQDWPWSLMDYLPSAAPAAGGRPSLVIWHFQVPGR
jgi:hypothetical protein